MSDVPGKFFIGQIRRSGTSGSSPGFLIGEADAPDPVNPPGSVPGGGGRDEDAVHYDADDGKNATEKQRARNNIDTIGGIVENIELDGTTVQTLERTSNTVRLIGVASEIRGMVRNVVGEIVAIYNDTDGDVLLKGGNFGNPSERFAFDLRLKQNYWSIFLGTNSTQTTWVSLDFIPTFKTGIRAVIDTTSITAHTFGNDGVETYRIGRNLSPTTGFTTNIFQTRSLFRDDIWYVSGGTSAGGGTLTGRFFASTGRFQHGRSAEQNQSIIRNEQRLYYRNTVTTLGVINDQALTDGIFNFRFTNADEITGFANGEIGRTITIQNDNSTDLILRYQNSGSIAANRLNLIGATDLTIPTKGKVDLIYCDGLRWELKSKNF